MKMALRDSRYFRRYRDYRSLEFADAVFALKICFELRMLEK
jgi:hypothetical protein